MIRNWLFDRRTARENRAFEQMLLDKAAQAEALGIQHVELVFTRTNPFVKLYPLGEASVHEDGVRLVFLSSDGAIYIRTIRGITERMSSFSARVDVVNIDGLLAKLVGA